MPKEERSQIAASTLALTPSVCRKALEHNDAFEYQAAGGPVRRRLSL